MSARKKNWIPVGEPSNQLSQDPELVALRAAREKEFAERLARMRVEEEPLLADLRKVGWMLIARGIWSWSQPIMLKSFRFCLST